MGMKAIEEDSFDTWSAWYLLADRNSCLQTQQGTLSNPHLGELGWEDESK